MVALLSRSFPGSPTTMMLTCVIGLTTSRTPVSSKAVGILCAIFHASVPTTIVALIAPIIAGSLFAQSVPGRKASRSRNS